jgi:hypothetical protein
MPTTQPQQAIISIKEKNDQPFGVNLLLAPPEQQEGNQHVATLLNENGFATLLADLLTPAEQGSDTKSQRVMGWQVSWQCITSLTFAFCPTG